MRLIKRQTTNSRSITGKGVQYDIDNQVIVDSERALLVPKGVSSERPSEFGIATAQTEGQVRYDTTSNQFEAYQDGGWRQIRFKEPNRDPGIVQQTLTGADATNIIFGKLANNTLFAPSQERHILVFVENVFQIATTNYTIIQNPPASDLGGEIDVTTATQGTQYKITTVGTTDFTLLGASSNAVDTVFNMNNVTPTGTGQVRATGYYLRFTSPPPFGKDITVLHNFDK